MFYRTQSNEMNPRKIRTHTKVFVEQMNRIMRTHFYLNLTNIYHILIFWTVMIVFTYDDSFNLHNTL